MSKKNNKNKKEHAVSDHHGTEKNKKHNRGKRNSVEKKNTEKSYPWFSGKGAYVFAGALVLVIISFLIFSPGRDSSGCQDGICDLDIAKNTPEGSGHGKIVAEFDSGRIYSDQFEKEVDLLLFVQGIPKEYASLIPKKELLNQTIMQEIVYQEALKNGYEADTDAVRNMLSESLGKSGMSIADLEDKLENESFDLDYYIEFSARQKAITDFINDTVLNGVRLDDGEALKYYHDNPDMFRTQEQIRASHILVNTTQEAEEIIALLDDGADFAELAKKYSIGPSASNGGDLGYFGKGMMVPEFEKAAFSLKETGEYTKEPVRTQFGYHIIKLTGKKDAGIKSFEEVKDALEAGLLRQKQGKVLEAYLGDLMKGANIKVYLEEDNAEPERAEQRPAGQTAFSGSEKPYVELFVMSYCPYGTQIEKGILPVADLLGDKINFEVKFVNYAMHGEKEVMENTRQYCIQKEQGGRYMDYLGCFLKAGDSDGCLKQADVDTSMLDSCMNSADDEYAITENLNNKQGNFPRFLIHDVENKEYGVRGSPTLVINGEVVSSGRDPAGLLETICSAFSDAPDECGTELSSDQPSPGFGYGTAKSSSQGGCGA